MCGVLSAPESSHCNSSRAPHSDGPRGPAKRQREGCSPGMPVMKMRSWLIRTWLGQALVGEAQEASQLSFSALPFSPRVTTLGHQERPAKCFGCPYSCLISKFSHLEL